MTRTEELAEKVESIIDEAEETYGADNWNIFGEDKKVKALSKDSMKRHGDRNKWLRDLLKENDISQDSFTVGDNGDLESEFFYEKDGFCYHMSYTCRLGEGSFEFKMLDRSSNEYFRSCHDRSKVATEVEDDFDEEFFLDLACEFIDEKTREASKIQIPDELFSKMRSELSEIISHLLEARKRYGLNREVMVGSKPLAEIVTPAMVEDSSKRTCHGEVTFVDDTRLKYRRSFSSGQGESHTAELIFDLDDSHSFLTVKSDDDPDNSIYIGDNAIFDYEVQYDEEVLKESISTIDVGFEMFRKVIDDMLDHLQR